LTKLLSKLRAKLALQDEGPIDMTTLIWGFPKIGLPLYRWMVYFMENPIYKWMTTGGTPHLWKPPYRSSFHGELLKVDVTGRSAST
jgi:hypothetical protein